MSRRLFFVPEVRRGRAELAGEDALHLTRVLRVEAGEQYQVSDNRSLYLAEVETARKNLVAFRVVEELDMPAPPPPVTLLVALIRFERFEWMIEKATEIGVTAIVPVWTGRSEKGLERAAEKRLDRWRKVALESSQQCRRPRLPAIEPPRSLAGALNSGEALRYFLEPGARPLLSVLPAQPASAAALVGPEGGWTDTERDEALAAGWAPVSISANILRTETAGITAVAILAAAWQRAAISQLGAYQQPARPTPAG